MREVRRIDGTTRASAPTFASARWARAPTTRRSCSTPASRRSTSASAARTSDGIYHSIYDDFYFYTQFLDTDFAYGRALAQTVGTAVIRLADADVLPFEFTNLADTVQNYVREVQDLLTQQQDEVRERNRQIDDGVFAAMRDPRKPRADAEVEGVPPAINFAPLENAVDRAVRSAERYEQALAAARPKVVADPAALAGSTRG